MAQKKVAKKDSNKAFSFVDQVLEGFMEIAQVSSKGEIKLKRTDVKGLLEKTFEEAAEKAAGGERIKIPFLGSLGYREIAARKAGKGKNPFTGEEIDIKARPASRKARFSFPKAVKEIFGNKKNW